jgi:hypothetical protein
MLRTAPFFPQKSSSKNSRSLFSDPETILSEFFELAFFADNVVVLPSLETVTSRGVFLLPVHPDRMTDNKKAYKQLDLKNFIIIQPPLYETHTLTAPAKDSACRNEAVYFCASMLKFREDFVKNR